MMTQLYWLVRNYFFTRCGMGSGASILNIECFLVKPLGYNNKIVNVTIHSGKSIAKITPPGRSEIFNWEIAQWIYKYHIFELGVKDLYIFKILWYMKDLQGYVRNCLSCNITDGLLCIKILKIFSHSSFLEPITCWFLMRAFCSCTHFPLFSPRTS